MLRLGVLSGIFCGLLLTSSCGEPTLRQAEPIANAQGKPAETATATPAATLDSTTKALDELFDVMQAAQRHHSFRARMEAEVGDEKSGFELEFAAPDRYRMRGKDFELVIIGDDGYLKLAEQWQRAPRDAADNSRSFNVGNAPVYWGAAAAVKLKPHTTVKAVSAVTVEGQPQKLFEYEMTEALGHQGRNYSRLWVSAADGLPRKTEVFGDYEGVKAHAVLTWLAYDTPVKIEAPVIQPAH